MRRVLRDYTHIYVQDQRSATLLAGIGINNVTVAGDTRFDRVTDVRKSQTSERAITRSKASGGIGRQAISAPSAVWQLAPLSATTPSNGSPASGVRLLAVRPVATKRRTPR